MSRKLMKVAGGVLAVRLAGGALGFAATAIIARLTTPHDFGLYSLVVATSGIVAAIGTLGLPTLVTRDVASISSSDQIGALGSEALILAVAGATILGAVIAGGAALGGTLAEGMDDLMPFVLTLGVLGAFNSVRAGIMRGVHAVVSADLPDTIAKPTTLIVLVVSFWLYNLKLDTSTALSLHLISIVVAATFGAQMLRRAEVTLVIGTSLLSRLISLTRRATPFWGIATLSVLEGYAPLLLIGAFALPSDVAMFSAASQIAGVLTLGLVSVNFALQSRMAEAWSRSDFETCQRIAWHAARLGFIIAAPGLAVIAAFSHDVIQLFGPDYIAAENALLMLLLGAFVNALLGPCRITLIVCGQHAFVFGGVCAALSVIALVSSIAIPHLGATGGAIGVTTGMIFWNVLFVEACRRRLGLRVTLLSRAAWRVRN